MLSRGYRGDDVGHIEQEHANVSPRESPAARDCDTYGSAPKHASRAILPRLMRALKARRPKLDVNVREKLTQEQTAALRTGGIDLGIGRPSNPGNRLSVVAKLDDPFCLAIPEGHPLAANKPIDLRDAAKEEFVSYMRDQPRAYFDQTVNFCNEAGFIPNVRYQASSTYGVIDLVSAGLGVTVVPASAATF
jgi:DNA-binding transcriptional LysR family regulator